MPTNPTWKDTIEAPAWEDTVELEQPKAPQLSPVDFSQIRASPSFQPSQFGTGGSVIDPAGEAERLMPAISLPKDVLGEVMGGIERGAAAGLNAITTDKPEFRMNFGGEAIPLREEQVPRFEAGRPIWTPQDNPMNRTPFGGFVKDLASSATTPGNLAMLPLAATKLARIPGVLYGAMGASELPASVSAFAENPTEENLYPVLGNAAMAAGGVASLKTKAKTAPAQAATKADSVAPAVIEPAKAVEPPSQTHSEVAAELGLKPVADVGGMWQFNVTDAAGKEIPFAVKAGAPKADITARAEMLKKELGGEAPPASKMVSDEQLKLHEVAEVDRILIKNANQPHPEATLESTVAKIDNGKQFTDESVNAIVNELRNSPDPISVLMRWRELKEAGYAGLQEAKKTGDFGAISKSGYRKQAGNEALEIIKDHGERLGFSKDIIERARELRDAPDTEIASKKTPNEKAQTTPGQEVLAEPVGMGAAAAGEVNPSPQTATSIKNAKVDVERQQRGLPPAAQPAKRAFGKVWDDAMASIDRDPGVPDRLINELRDKPRSLTDLEDATLLHRQIDLQNEYGKATRDLAQAFDDGRMESVTVEQARVQALSDQLLDLYNIGKKVGTETGRGLNARKMMAMEDFSLAKMELEKRAANEGRPLTPKERTELVDASKRIEETQKKFDEYVTKTDRQLAERDMQAALDEMQKGVKSSTPKFPKAEDITAQKEKIRLKLDEGERSEVSSLVQRLARMFVEQGIRVRDPLIDAVHGVLKEIDPQFTRRETMDAISGYGDFKQLTKDEISLKLRDLKGQMQQVAKLEDMQANKPPLKTGVERRIPSTEESRLIRLVNEAKNQFQIPITDPATQLKSSLDTLKARLKNETAKWEDKLKAGDFSKKPKRVIQMDAEANKLHFENTQAKAKWHEALMKDRLARRSVPQKIFAGVGETINTARAIMTSFDLSAVLRQGGFIVLGHPLRGAKSIPAMFKAFRSEAAQHAVNREITNRKNYPLMTQSKLYLSEHGQKLSQMEEAYMSRWADKIPLVAGSQRAYTTFLNKLRADSFDAMANSLSATGELTPVGANAIANYINVATGRGNLGMKDNALVGLNTVFFAPRYVASRFQLALGQPMYRGTARTRTAVAKEYARYLAGLGVVYALGKSAGAEVETDPRSADFGKMKWGDTRLDPLSGLSQTTVLMSRLASGETKTLKGEIKPIRGPDVPFGSGNSADVMARFLRTKLAPAPSAIVDTLVGKDVVGQPVTATSTAQHLMTPLAMRDIYNAMLEQGIPEGTALGLLSIFGMGLQTYEDKK